MAEQPLNLAIPRLKANEDRVNTFVNGSDTTDMQPATGAPVPSVRKIVKKISTDAVQLILDKTAEIDASIVQLIATKDTEINESADGVLEESRLAAETAKRWSENPVDVEVELGMFSSKHYANQTAADRIAIAVDRTAVSDGVEQVAQTAGSLEVLLQVIADNGFVFDWGFISEAPGEYLDYGSLT